MINKRLPAIMTALIAILVLNTGCDRGNSDRPVPPAISAGTNTWNASAQIESLGLPTNSPAYQLARCLPDTIDTIVRHIIVTENQTHNGTGGAMVKANYMGVENGALELIITDCGPNRDGAPQAGMEWTTTLMERESLTEYTRAFRRDGIPVLETYNRNQRYGHLKTLVDQRWLIEVTVFGLPANLLHKAMLSIDLSNLRRIPPHTSTVPRSPSAEAVSLDRLIPALRQSPAPAAHTPGSGRADTGPGP